jgi:arylesterase / paraoxonase
MSIDSPSSSGGFEYKTLKPTGYVGAGGESALYFVGMTGRATPSSVGSVDLYLVNAQPSFHPNNTLKDQASEGGNSTIEIFTTTPGSASMRHTHTFFHPQLATPNNVGLMPDGSIYFTNDHGLSRSGGMHELSTLLRTGDVSWCSAPSTKPQVCKRVASGYAFPNGLHYSNKHDRLFVPSAALGHVYVYKPLPNHDLQFLEKIHLPYPIDNMSEDSEGNIIAAVLPKFGEIFEKFKDHDPSNSLSTAVLRDMRFGKDGSLRIKKEPVSAAFIIKRTGRGTDGETWEAKKLIEDRDGEVLPASTTVIRDGKTGRLFFSSVVSEWIAWCEPK